MRVFLVSVVGTYLVPGFVTSFVFSLWDTLERAKQRVYWYPGFGLAGVLIILTWPAFAYGMYRVYKDRAKGRH